MIVTRNMMISNRKNDFLLNVLFDLFCLFQQNYVQGYRKEKSFARK